MSKTTLTRPPRVAIYTRVSRDDSGEGKSNDRQEAEARRLCEYKRWDVVTVVRDVSVSAAGKVKRPGWEQILAMIEAGEIDYVVAYAMDRLTRSMLDLERLIVICDEKRVGIATVDGDIDLTSEMGRMIARILAAVARAEIDIKSRRQKLANAVRAGQGDAHSGGVRPFGYEDDRLTLVPAEARAIQRGAERALAGEPLAAIAKSWADAGLVSSRAEKAWEKGARPTYAGWSAQGVKRLLVNPRYAGIRIYNGERVGAGKWKAILDLETHLRLVETLSDPTRRRGEVHRGRTPSTLLTGILRCAVCDSTVRASAIGDQLTYCCQNGCCQINRRETDEWVLAGLVAELSNENWLKHLGAKQRDELLDAKQIAEEQRESLKTYARLLASGAMDEEQFAEASIVARGLAEDAEAMLARAGQVSALAGLSLGSREVGDQVRGLSLERQRAVVQQVLRCVLRPQNRNRRDLYPVHERVLVESAA